jgi:hypothetical protein
MPQTRRIRPPAVFQRDVLDEIRRRANTGHPLNSGANRGDWLYAGAVRFFGSWGKAVEAAGIRYQSVKQAGLSRAELLVRIRKAAAAGPLIAGEHQFLQSNARRLCGSWKRAVAVAGCELPSYRKIWSQARVIEAIKDDLDRGLPVTSLAVIRRNQPLYGAARREFGSWRKALKAVDPKLTKQL